MANLTQGIEKKESMKGGNGLKSTFLALMIAAGLFSACNEDGKDNIISSSSKETENVTAPFLDGPTGSARGIGDMADTDSKQYSPIEGLSPSEAAQKLENDGLYIREKGQSDEEFIKDYEKAVASIMIDR